MLFLLELLVSSIRIMMLFFGALFTFLLGEHLYRYINNAFFTYSIPCMEMLSFIIAVVGPIAYFFGIHRQKGFFKRGATYNKGIFILSFGFGAVITFLPITGAQVSNAICTEQISMISKVFQALLTGIITASIAYLSFDVGAFQAQYLTPLLQNRKQGIKKRKK